MPAEHACEARRAGRKGSNCVLPQGMQPLGDRSQQRTRPTVEVTVDVPGPGEFCLLVGSPGGEFKGPDSQVQTEPREQDDATFDESLQAHWGLHALLHPTTTTPATALGPH